MLNRDPSVAQPGAAEGAVALSRFSRRTRAHLFPVLVLAAALPYANTLRNGFVYDDTTQVLGNPYIQNFHHLQEIFTTGVWSYVGDFRGKTNYYRPVMTLGYLLCMQGFGPRPVWFHLANVVLHAAVVCMVFLITERMFQAAGLAFLAAAIFALHPIHTEAVDWIAGVTDLEVTFFCVLTFWFFLGLSRPERNRWGLGQLGMVGSFILAMLSKETALMLPVVSTVYEHFVRPDRAGTTWAQKLSRYGLLWLLVLAYLVVRVHLLGVFAPSDQRPYLGPLWVCISALALAGQYVWKLLWPARLSAYYVFPENIVDLVPWAIAGCAVLSLCALLFAVLWRRNRMASFGLVWMFTTLAPVLNPRWMAGNVFTERYLYLPSVGFCWTLAWGGVQLWEASVKSKAVWRWTLAAAACLMALVSAVRIVSRNRDWRDDVTLFRSTLALSPDATYIHNNLGAVYWRQGDVEAAQQEWDKAQRLAPNDAIILHNLGLVAKEQKRYTEAVGIFMRALRITPNFTDAHLDLGETYLAMDSRRDAELQFVAAVALSPLNTRARNTLGNFYFDDGRLADAAGQFRRSLESQPTREAYWGVGLVDWRRGDRDQAERAFKSAEALDPSNSRAHIILGMLYADAGRTSEAAREYQAVLQIDPTNVQAREALKKLGSQPPDAKSSKP